MTGVTDAALGVVRAVMEVAASPERVWRALTDPKELEAWWGASDMYQTFDWKSDLRPGGERSCQARSPQSKDLSTVKGEYVAVDPPKLLEFTWLASWEPGSTPTRVRIELDAVPKGTRVTVVHSGFGAGEQKRVGGYTDGWNRVLGWLAGRVGPAR
jgi:uncharacterized protein YndB with AHSA1/START domain